MGAIFQRLLVLLRRRRLERDLDDELAFHLAMRCRHSQAERSEGFCRCLDCWSESRHN